MAVPTRTVLLQSILSGGALGLVAGAAFGFVAGGCGGAFLFGGYGFVGGLVTGAVIGVATDTLLRLLRSDRPAEAEADYADGRPPD